MKQKAVSLKSSIKLKNLQQNWQEKKDREDHLAILGIKKEYHYRSCKLKCDSNNFTQVFLTTYEMN